ncbi:MAG: hypothetical protein LUO89_13510 [Methanothrix sp.]|nr:hypothetical protein [Methanothrix sp.]
MLNRMVLLLSLMLALVVIGAAAIASQDSVSENFKGKDYIAENSSCNKSSISFVGQNKIVSAPVDLTVGSGYYSSHPIPISLGIGSRTQLANGNSATSMSHEIGSAQEVSGRTEYVVSSSSSHGDYEDINSATTHMQIDENVTGGKVHIGVLSGSDSSAGNNGNSGIDPMNSAWKDPAIEIEEEYIGTYHISKNFTINSSFTQKRFADSWQNCCGESYAIYPPEPVFISADDVFNCRRCK